MNIDKLTTWQFFILGEIIPLKMCIALVYIHTHIQNLDHAAKRSKAPYYPSVSRSVSLSRSQQVFQHFKEQLLAIFLQCFFLPFLEYFISVPHLTCANRAGPYTFTEALRVLDPSCLLWFITVFRSDLWLWQTSRSLIIHLMQAWATNQSSEPPAWCKRLVYCLSMAFNLANEARREWEPSWECQPDLSRDESVIITLWFANGLQYFSLVAVGVLGHVWQWAFPQEVI